MKVNIYETVEISDEQRVQLGAVLDGRVKPKRQATREEIKSYIWDRGSRWDSELSDDYRHDFEEAETGSQEAQDLLDEAADELAALLGDDADDDDEDLI